MDNSAAVGVGVDLVGLVDAMAEGLRVLRRRGYAIPEEIILERARNLAAAALCALEIDA